MLYADGGWCISLAVPFFSKSWFTDKSPAIQSLLRLLASTYPSEDASKPHPIDLPHSITNVQIPFPGRTLFAFYQIRDSLTVIFPVSIRVRIHSHRR